jgi:hypothetical protein
LKLSIFRHATDPVVAVVHEGTWTDFAGGLNKPAGADTPKADLPLWSAAEFRDGHRAANGVTAVHALTLDIDEAPIPSRAELESALAGSQAVVHSSSSATKDAPRWRGVLALSRPVTGDEYRRLWSAVTGALPFGVGQAAKDPSRAWYAPRVGSDGYFEHFRIEGEPIDVDEVLAAAPEGFHERREKSEAPGVPVATSPRAERMRVKRHAAASLLGSAWPAKGQRHPAEMALLGALRRDGWEQPDAIEFTKAVYRNVADKPLGPRLTAKIKSDAGHTWSTAANVTGWTTLESYVDPLIVSSVRDLMNANADGAEALKRELGWGTTEVTAPEVTAKRLSPADRARRVGGGDVARLKTGLPSIDTATRGGLLLRKLVAVGGAPGAGKTAAMVALAFRWLNEGVPRGVSRVG